MPLPPSIKEITVTHKYTNPDGSPSKGTVTFQLSATGVASMDNTSVPSIKSIVVLDGTGAISINLPASNDPNWAQSGLSYSVLELIDGASPRKYNIVVPYDATDGKIDLPSCYQVTPGPVIIIYETPSGSQAKADAALAAAIAASLPRTGGILTGALQFGDDDTADVSWYRSSPGTLRTDGAVSIGSGVGFYGGNPIAKPDVSGSRGGNTSLGSLISALVALGLVSDSTVE